MKYLIPLGLTLVMGCSNYPRLPEVKEYYLPEVQYNVEVSTDSWGMYIPKEKAIYINLGIEDITDFATLIEHERCHAHAHKKSRYSHFPYKDGCHEFFSLP